VGQIGSSELGFELLEESGVVETISALAKSCSTLSMRGTCFYVLGLLSRTAPGRDALAALGWDFSVHTDSGVIVPRDFAEFAHVPPVTYCGSWASDPENCVGASYVDALTAATEAAAALPSASGADPAAAAAAAATDAQRRSLVLGHITQLGISNHVIQRNSLQALRQLRTANKALFEDAVLLYEVMKLLASYAFGLPARRFVLFELFGRVRLDDSASVFDGEPLRSEGF
jgi:hypothetical protein